MTKSQDRLKDVVWCGKTACPCVRFSHVSEPGDPEAAATMYLIVGPTRGGKTLLLKRLMLHATTRDVGDGDVPPTVPTVGTNLVNVSLGKKSEITVRELGGSMAPIWHNYYRDCRHLMFAIDLSDRARVAAACVQLTDALSSPELPRS
ncbi:PREDICTED: ADP-ribosylation factor-like protein 16, partial [Priapulus caudatus]|uniref:ADP-ribosylation factor-like protein 16 n=1 Tax=Priapulus caudatus TaxID=37621 RepID=A0ABM1EC51_PRICU